MSFGWGHLFVALAWCGGAVDTLQRYLMTAVVCTVHEEPESCFKGTVYAALVTL